MPFDSFMTAALTKELNQRLIGLKVDKVCQPERDEVDLLFHVGERNRLVINCTASTPFIALSSEPRENPPTPPMMCMLLRKHLSRAKISAVEQLGFDRIIRICFDSGDELGFFKSKNLYCEMMGRGSNLIFTDEADKILAAFRQNDITTKFDRIVMVGMPYQPMPIGDRVNPIECTEVQWMEMIKDAAPDCRADLFLQKRFFGFGKLTAREIVYRAAHDPEAPLSHISPDALWKSFSEMINLVKEGLFSPCLIYENRRDYEEGKSPLDFSFTLIDQFSPPFYVHPCSSVSEAIERFYLLRNRVERQKQHYNDIAQILKNCKNRLEKKISAQQIQLEEARDAEEDKRKGDLVMQELYRIRRGDREVIAMDYSLSEPKEVRIPLDHTMTPSQNAQYYYREYSKKKTAQVKVLEQIEIAKRELDYADSVLASLQTASVSADLEQIRQELSHWSYGRRLTTGLKKPQNKQNKARPRELKTKNGFTVFIGMNNFQNDTVSTSLADKEDLWFHVKNYHGSHVLLKAKADQSFADEDLEFAAGLAAYYSQVQTSDRVEVDYTMARFVKKPNGSKPGFVSYKNQKTVIVAPCKEN